MNELKASMFDYLNNEYRSNNITDLQLSIILEAFDYILNVIQKGEIENGKEKEEVA